MATQGQFYYGNNDPTSYIYDMNLDKTDTRIASHPIVTPRMPQASTLRQQHNSRQRYDTNSSISPRDLTTEQSCFQTHDNINTEYEAVKEVEDHGCQHKPISSSSSSRTESLKRRSSLREAARSLRTSKVAKRIRRHVKAEFDMEDGDDAGVSASESDNPIVPQYGAMSLSQHEHEPPQRPQSVVSNLASGLRSQLTIRTYSRDRALSLASQTSNWGMDSSDSASTNTSCTSLSSTSKRARIGDDGDCVADDEDFKDRIGKRPCQSNLVDPDQTQLFACPFAKHDPKRYSAANLEELNYRGCSQSYLTDLARVKQHLYRVHERPQHHCPTCFEVFKNEPQYTKHVALQACRPRACPFGEKMTPEQLNAIKKKNRGTDPYLGWYEIYRTLFPKVQPPMSPYAAFTATVDTLELFMDFVMKELPGRLRSQSGCGDKVASAVYDALPDVLRDLRRDFHHPLQPHPETVGERVEKDIPSGRRRNSPTEINFHQMVTYNSTQHDPSRVARPSAIDLPSPKMYNFPSISPTQLLSNTDATSPRTISIQPSHEDYNVAFPQQGLSYPIHDHAEMQAIHADPLTAIWQPDEQESQIGYFAGQHQTQELLPAYSLHFESEDSWIPAMVTTRMDYHINDHGIQSMDGGLLHGGYGNHVH